LGSTRTFDGSTRVTFHYRKPAIKLTLASNVGLSDLECDWILVHEMCHLALPTSPRRQHWFEEAMATYVEPLARAQPGVLEPVVVWGGLLKGLPLGLPQAGDRGLDLTPIWGRTYWGGALFCLFADVAMRERTFNRRGLQQALRAIMAYGNMEIDSPIEPLLAIGDRAVGEPALAELYARMKDRPFPVDLQGLWQRLGVRLEGATLAFDDAAPLASIRRALIERPPN
jgi:hypothetical protein